MMMMMMMILIIMSYHYVETSQVVPTQVTSCNVSTVRNCEPSEMGESMAEWLNVTRQ